MEHKEIHVYTDGSSRGNPGPGGYGIVMEQKGSNYFKEFSEGFRKTTNNRMELMAAISALTALSEPCSVVLTTDSTYVKDGITKWIRNWKANGWRTAAKKPVKNKDLWQQLDVQCLHHTVDWRWVKGHSGVPGNERVDALANAAIDALLA